MPQEKSENVSFSLRLSRTDLFCASAYIFDIYSMSFSMTIISRFTTGSSTNFVQVQWSALTRVKTESFDLLM